MCRAFTRELLRQGLRRLLPMFDVMLEPDLGPENFYLQLLAAGFSFVCSFGILVMAAFFAFSAIVVPYQVPTWWQTVYMYRNLCVILLVLAPTVIDNYHELTEMNVGCFWAQIVVNARFSRLYANFFTIASVYIAYMYDTDANASFMILAPMFSLHLHLQEMRRREQRVYKAAHQIQRLWYVVRELGNDYSQARSGRIIEIRSLVHEIIFKSIDDTSKHFDMFQWIQQTVDDYCDRMLLRPYASDASAVAA